MENVIINNTSWDKNYNYSNINFSYPDDTSISNGVSFIDVVHWIIICIELPLTLVAIFAVLSLVKNDHVTPVYVINLLISDLVQLGSRIALMTKEPNIIVFSAHIFGLMASVGFMVCISLERYLLIAKPLWYRFRRNVKITLVVCIMVWVFPLLLIVTFYFDFEIADIILAFFLLVPLPLFIFFLFGTIKALSSALSVPADEKRRIVAVLVVVLFIYTLLFLPFIITLLVTESTKSPTFETFATINVCINPLADSLIYILLRKRTMDRLFASLCCISDYQQRCTMNTDNMPPSYLEATVAQVVRVRPETGGLPV